MPALRIIPCLDVKNGRVVKGVQFQNLQDVADPVELVDKYFLQGADEITLLDVSASLEGRLAMIDVVAKCAESTFVPLTVGGGIQTVSQVRELLAAGADKVSIGSAVTTNPDLVDEVASKFGSQVLVVSLDVRRAATASGFAITRLGGTEETQLDAAQWIKEVSERGAGELLVNSMDSDGTKTGFDIELMKLVREISNLPIIASGGAGKLAHFVEAAKSGADALLAASVFHTGSFTIGEVKAELAKNGVEVRI
ncbi:MAG: imidazole glycerol phosphate synthase subunit HisF [Actinomycetota bacterium]